MINKERIEEVTRDITTIIIGGETYLRGAVTVEKEYLYVVGNKERGVNTPEEDATDIFIDFHQIKMLKVKQHVLTIVL